MQALHCLQVYQRGFGATKQPQLPPAQLQGCQAAIRLVDSRCRVDEQLVVHGFCPYDILGQYGRNAALAVRCPQLVAIALQQGQNTAHFLAIPGPLQDHPHVPGAVFDLQIHGLLTSLQIQHSKHFGPLQ